VLNAAVGWWWADSLAAIGIAFLAVREGMEILRDEHQPNQADAGDEPSAARIPDRSDLSTQGPRSRPWRTARSTSANARLHLN
jgi:hypothetical protein